MRRDEKMGEIISRPKEIFKLYYSDRKWLIDIIGFTGIIASLFLQINQYQTESLRMLQCLLLLIFGLLIGYCIIDFWIRYAKTSVDNLFENAIGGIILSIGIIIFLGSLFSFIKSVFANELRLIFLYNSVAIAIITVYFLVYFALKLQLAYPQKKKLILILLDIMAGVLGYIFTILILGKPFYSLLVMLYMSYYTFLSILFSLNIIKTIKVLNIMILISCLLFMLAQYLSGILFI